MKIILKLIIMLTIVSFTLYGQVVQLPWGVVDGGGGVSTSTGMVLNASIGQPAVQKMTYIDTGSVLESGFIPGARNLGGTLTNTTISMQPAWNLLSIPLLGSDMRKTTLFQNSVSNAFSYEPGGYVAAETLRMGTGYWLRYSVPDTQAISGTRVSIDTIPVYLGWNMIGALTYPMLASSVIPVPPVTFSSSFFGYSPSRGYYNVDTLKPGAGYWIRASRAGSIVLDNTMPLYSNISSAITQAGSPTLTTTQLLDPTSGYSNLKIQDAVGRERAIFYSESPKSIDLGKCQLPPVPPEGILDVRFTSQRYVEIPDQSNSGKEEKYPLSINSAVFPFIIRWDNIATEGKYSLLRIYYTNGAIKEIDLVGQGCFIVREGDDYLRSELIVRTIQSNEIPKEYALHDNYPNPFNPATKFQYDLPVNSRVTLKVFDILGRVVAIVVDEVQDAGYKTINWNALDEGGCTLSTGVYFYQLVAGDYKAVKKMLLVR
jgi:hypothetical protein